MESEPKRSLGKSLKRFLQYLNESDKRKDLLRQAISSAPELEQEAKERLLLVTPPSEDDDIAFVTPGVLLQSKVDSEGYPTGDLITIMNDPGVISLARRVQGQMDELLGANERRKREDRLLQKKFNAIKPSDPTLG